MKKLFITLTLVSLATMSIVLTSVHSQAPQAKFRRARAGRIPNQYLVVLRNDVTEVDREVARLMQQNSAARLHTYRSAIKGFSVRMSEAQAQRLAQDPRVMFVEEDSQVTLSTTQIGATWGLDRIDQRDLPLDNSFTYQPTGSGVTAYVIDTGIRSTHTDFGRRVAPGFSAINDGLGTNDCNGHGTHVAGTIGSNTYGVAKEVTLVPVRVFGCGSFGSFADIIAGVDWVTANHNTGAPAVANMSLGGPPNSAFELAVTNSINDGVSCVVAAGNGSGADACAQSPANVRAANTVASTDNTDTRSGFSNVGSCVDVFAPGSAITSTWNTSDNATAVLQGTSMAAPHVSGYAALYLQTNPVASPATVSAIIIANATPNKITDAGTGSPNRLLFINGGGKRMRDDLILHRPGSGAIFTLKSNEDGTFTPVHTVGDNGSALPNGIGGYDLLSVNDQMIPFDYNGDGKDDLFLYRPGQGAAWVLRSNGDGTFAAVYTVGDNGSAPPNGIGGYDLLSTNDRVFPFDYNGDGKDDLFFYRPGQGAAWVLRSNGDATFTAVYTVGDNGSAPPNGIGGYDLLSSRDRVFPFDFNGDGKDDLFLCRPGQGAAWVLSSNGDGTFAAVHTVGDNGPALPNGIGGYDLLSINDRVMPFDFNGDGKDDLFLYRPGQGAAWILRSKGDGAFAADYTVGDNGSAPPNGIGGYDLLSVGDQVFRFDFDGDGRDDLFLYRPGQGAAWVLRSNGDSTFTAVHTVGDNGSAPPNGIGGYDLLSVNDRVFPFDFNQDGKDDLFLYRPGQGAAWVVRSNGDGSFAAVYTVGDNGSAPPNGVGGYDLLSTRDRVFALDYQR